MSAPDESVPNEGAKSPEELLADVLAGTRKEEDDAVQHAARNPDFAAELQSLRQLDRAVQRGLVDERSARAAAESPIDTAVRDRALLQLRSARFRRRTWFTPWSVAAAAALAFAAAWWYWSPPARPEVMLGPAMGLQAAPDYAAFQWTAPSGLGIGTTTAFHLRVRDAAGRLLDSARVTDARWQPDAARRSTYPAEVQLEIVLVGQGDEAIRTLAVVQVARDGRVR